MKRKLKTGLALLTVLTMGISLVGCGGAGDTSAAVEGELTNGGNYIFATGGTSGTYYPLGGAMATIINGAVEGTNITVQSTGASKENIMLVSKGEADYAIVQNDVLDYADKGIELFNGEKVTGLSTVASIYPEIVQLVVGADSGIKTVGDLKGKRVSIGDAGSGVEANAIQVLGAYGMTVDDIKVSRLSFKESGNAFKDNQIDAFFVTAGVPNTAVVELAITRPIQLLNIDGAEADKLVTDHPFYTNITISKDVYGTQTDINTIAVRALIIARADLNESEVYNFTKALYENLDTVGQSHAKGKEILLEQAKDGVTVALHPGSAKYYSEAGLG
ncbi:MAG: TAXI family TRAP transporter solute-binding subunit [Proteocatella sp.]